MFVLCRYSTLSDSDLLQLPVRELSAAGALVVVWVTNKLQQQRFVKDHLFPYWNVTCLAEWYWLKVDNYVSCCFECNKKNIENKVTHLAFV